MTSYELAQLIDRFVDSFRDDTIVLRCLKSLSNSYDQLTPKFLSGAQKVEGNGALQHCRDLATDINAAVDQAKSAMSPSIFYSQLEKMIESADSFSTAFPQQVPAIAAHLRDFQTAYDKYLNRQRADTAGIVLFEAHQTFTAILALRETLSALSAALVPEVVRREDEDTLTLKFDDETDLETLARRLAMLAESYRLFCELTQTLLSEYPLRIVKVETGSMFISVIGALLPIGLLSKFIGRGAKIFFQRNFREGQIDREAEFRSQISQVLDLRNELNEAGINTDGMDAQISAAAEKSADYLFALIDGSRTIDINGTHNAPEDPQKLLPFVKPLARLSNDSVNSTTIRDATNTNPNKDDA